ncbi:MAG: hypothetical protein JST84_07500 [Acidobacteria bacterium]|nr:hypothetical protein [Acidobacteriota bacterium]
MSRSAATPTKGLTPQVAKDTLAYLRRAIEKMKSLQATERVIAYLERAALSRLPKAFDLKSVVISINALNLALREGNEAKIRVARKGVDEELEAAFENLIRRDDVIMPYDLRRFCDGDSSLLDLNSLAALTSFYRALPPTDASRSKYDFVITRLFSNTDPGQAGRQRHLRINRKQIAKRLIEMCRAWGENLHREDEDSERVTQYIKEFDNFIVEIKTINKLEILVSKSFFQRIRDFKTRVGNALFLPEVTAASVEANVIIANHFLSLLEIESEEMREAPAMIQNLVDAFSDTYSNGPDEISRILAELQASSQHCEVEQGRVSRFMGLLRLATKAEEKTDFQIPALLSASTPELTDELPDDLNTGIETAMTEVANNLEAESWQVLAEQPENQELLAGFHKASAEVRKLDLHCFLSPLPDGENEDLKGENKARRASLELIFNADKVIQNELGEDCEPGEDIEVRMDRLFEALGQRSDETRELIKAAHKHSQNTNYEVLLHVYNQLMAARLRLQSAIVRRSASEITPYETAEKEEGYPPISADSTPEVVQKTIAPQTTTPATSGSWLKWMVAVAILLIVAVAGLRFASSKNKVPVKDDTDVVRLAQNQVPFGELFAERKLHRDLLLCVATEKWLTLSAQDQKGKLQELLHFGQGRGALRVLLVDAKGVTVASATNDELYVN